MDFTFTVEVGWFLIVIGWLGGTTRCYIVWHMRTHSLAFIQDFESVGSKDVHGGSNVSRRMYQCPSGGGVRFRTWGD
jgi:hypothetical protein